MRAGLRRCDPGDQIVSPLGEVLYIEPRFLVPDTAAYAYTLSGRTIGVLVLRRGDLSTLIYCDSEGRKHEEKIMADTFEQHMEMGANRMSVLIGSFLGERHPLADRAVANKRPI